MGMVDSYLSAVRILSQGEGKMDCFEGDVREGQMALEQVVYSQSELNNIGVPMDAKYVAVLTDLGFHLDRDGIVARLDEDVDRARKYEIFAALAKVGGRVIYCPESRIGVPTIVHIDGGYCARLDWHRAKLVLAGPVPSAEELFQPLGWQEGDPPKPEWAEWCRQHESE
jgi:hypothetical protein